MAEIVNEESRTRSVVENSNGQRSQSGEALVEWRSSDQLENGSPSTSPPYWDTDDDDDDGQKPSELYGRHTWKIDKFSEINKREHRSSAFAVGGFKWYILIYPQGCDVCNHLSLFLCVANHDKLLPGWSHFAQFTIAVVNKDPKKSKFSDTLHRFWKKEHDWGWKKFMELPKLQDGFIDDSDTLIIKAQVQVIRERVDRPFRCLDCQYRRELVRVYLTNVEQICRRFVEERRSKLGRLIEDKARWTGFCAFWLGMDQNSRRRMSREKMGVILKVVVKHFFIEKEVTSTLVMDSLYSGLKALEGRQAKSKKSRPRLLDAEESPAPIITVDKDMFVLVDDVLLLLERAALEPLPPKDEKGPQNRTKEGNAGEEFNKEAIERDERRLTELGRRTVEIFVLAHIFSNKIEAAYQEAVALKRQEELIREEEEEAWLAESEQRAKRGGEKEKKSKKKQAKQKRNKNKGKEKRREEKVSSPTDDKDSEETQGDEKKDSLTGNAQSTAEKPETLGDVSDISDSVDGSGEILQPDSEDRDSSPLHWETDTSEIIPTPTGGSSSRGRGTSISISNGVSGRKNHSVMDDSSSTCSNHSILSGVTNGFYQGHMLNHHYNLNKSPTKGKNQNRASSERCKVGVSEADAVVSYGREAERFGGRSPVKNVGNVQMKQNAVSAFDMDRPKEKSTASPRTAHRNHTSILQPKAEEKGVPSVDTVPTSKIVASNGLPSSSDQASVTLNIQSNTVTVGPRSEKQKEAVALKPAEKSMAQPPPSISRPSSAPIIPPQVRANPVISMVQTTSSLARSASSAGRLGPDPSPSSQPYIPQSYKNAIVGNTTSGSSSSNRLSSPAAGVSSLSPYSQPPPSSGSYQSGFPFSLGPRDGLSGGLIWTGGSSSSQKDRTVSMNRDSLKAHPYTPIASRSLEQTQSLVTDEFPHLDIINDLLEDEHGSNMMMGGSGFHVVPQLFNSSSQYTYHHGTGSELGLSGELLSCRSSRSYSDEGFHHAYGHFDSLVEYMPHSSASASASASPYANGQMDGLIPTQWQMANMELSLRAMRNPDEAPYPPFGSEATNSNPSLSASINGGYTEFRPSKGH